ncbi:hypothetical protein J4218_06535 [Candidatus Pacearchaeota archaeon]|nr:hypothetical protein [Candidatus Pacearchaeota archaeon]
MDLTSIGLIIIAIAWIIQLFYVFKNKKEIQPLFVIFYMLGVIVLMTGIYLASKTISYYELLTVIASALVLGKLYWLKKSKKR